MWVRSGKNYRGGAAIFKTRRGTVGFQREQALRNSFNSGINYRTSLRGVPHKHEGISALESKAYDLLLIFKEDLAAVDRRGDSSFSNDAHLRHGAMNNWR